MNKKTAGNMGLALSGLDGSTLTFLLLSTSVPAEE